ncbi:ankyrin repeat-containing domain protein [Dunaliella salina]|uniref:Ankyrin repeat-containing domain protein n=1 Tax=Dunaliella salina TaxID=3046 RepID=A0ABQ7FRB0_DUNSA|nr:ankyrin repeat-containing domain protein [Dunaliella salina]|eukprot:KAF5825256.1 ankyrin repeat-containing domain protein [Dunaliella salina]
MGISCTTPAKRSTYDYDYFAYRETPLQLAVKIKAPKVVEFLWSQEDVHAHVDVAIKALFLAASLGHVECLQILLASSSPLNANNKNTNGLPPLITAVYNMHPGVVEVLLAHGASHTFKNKEGDTLLHLACFVALPDWNNQKQKTHFEIRRNTIVRRLLDADSSRKIINDKNNDGNTPLHIAVKKGLLNCCNELLKSRASYTIKNNAGKTPFQELCARKIQQTFHISINNPSYALCQKRLMAQFESLQNKM